MNEPPNRPPYRGSLVWPILLIGAGVIFLMANLDLLPANSWILAVRLWPVALILLGLDLVIGHRSRAGMLLSGLVALLFVAGLIALVALAPLIPALNTIASPGEIQSQNLQVPLENVQTARVVIDWNPGENTLQALPPNSPNLLQGQVEYYGNLTFDVNKNGTNSVITLDNRLQPAIGLVLFSSRTRWSISLNPGVVYNLALDTGSGQYLFDLSGLQLSEFRFDSGSGVVNLSLPPGDFRGFIDGGSGSIALSLPGESAVRLEIDSGSGNFTPGSALELVSGEADGDGIWETPNYGQASERILLVIDQGSGSISVGP